MRNIISKTGQTWKMSFSLLVLILCVGVMVLAMQNIATWPKLLFFITLSGCAVAGLLAFAFTCASIKCPECGTRWFWQAVSERHSQAWALWLKSLTSCPHCGYKGE